MHPFVNDLAAYFSKYDGVTTSHKKLAVLQFSKLITEEQDAFMSMMYMSDWRQRMILLERLAEGLPWEGISEGIEEEASIRWPNTWFLMGG